MKNPSPLRENWESLHLNFEELLLYMSEAEQIPSSILSIEYRNHVTQVPFAQSIDDLKTQLKNHVLPALTRLKALNQNVDLAITEYVYSKDESIVGQSEKLKKLLDKTGIETSEQETKSLISRREGLNPLLSDRLSWRKEEESNPVDDEHLPFAARTYVIGPMVVSKEVFKSEGGPTFEEDVKASTFFIGNSVAVDGDTLIEVLGKKLAERMTNSQLVQIIESLLNEK